MSFPFNPLFLPRLNSGQFGFGVSYKVAVKIPLILVLLHENCTRNRQLYLRNDKYFDQFICWKFWAISHVSDNLNFNGT